MPLHLVTGLSNPDSFLGHPVSKLRYERRRSRVTGDCGSLERTSAQIISLAPRTRANVAGNQAVNDIVPHDERLNHAAEAQGEREDHDLVLLAACKLADSVHDLDALLNWGRSDWKRAALARCVAKGWVVVQGHSGTPLQTFSVTPEGYRAADLSVPPSDC
jgi:hypothetical protein